MEPIKRIFSWREIRSSHRLMLLIVLTLGILNLLWGEKVPAGGGFGWDGVLYGEMVRHLDSMIAEGRISAYHAQRILPSAIVRAMLLFSGSSMTDANIIRAYEIYNLSLLVGACFVWKRVANHFLLSLRGRWIGFSGIFINFQCSKQSFYEPVLTDVTALLIAMLLLLFYVEKKPLGIFLTAVVGAFCWPLVSLSGALLLIFPRAETPADAIAASSSNSIAQPKGAAFSFQRSAMLVLVFSVAGYLALTLMVPMADTVCSVVNDGGKSLANGVSPSAAAKLEKAMGIDGACSLPRRFLTAIPSIFGMTLLLATLIGSTAFLRRGLVNLRTTRLSVGILAISAIILPFFIVKFISNPSVASPSGLFSLIQAVFLPQAGQFLLPLVTLGVFWGPLVLLLLLRWKAFCVEARKLGLGAVLVVGMTLLLGLVGEPRFLTIAWPFLVLGLVLALESSSTTTSFKYALTTLTILFAQFWLTINYEPWVLHDNAGLLEFPKQLFFMHYGLWMSSLTYAIQLILLVLGAIWLYKSGMTVDRKNSLSENLASVK